MTSQRLAAVPHPADRAASPTTREEWWRDAVIYQVYPRSFADSDGDGMGDLPGDPRAAAVPAASWAWTPSGCRRSTPRRRPTAATTWRTTARSTRCSARCDDADELVREAHGLGLRVIVDIVPNHCSDQHEWFRRALRGRARARAMRDRFHFRPGQGRERRAAAERLGVDLRRPGLDPDRPSRTAPPASGTCTCSRPSSPTSTGSTRRSARSSARSCASGSTSASTASGSTSPTA